MKISTKCRYGLRALLAISRRSSQIPLKRREIADSEGISDAYLENILIALKNSGIIETVRGARGGYVLARSPAAISILEIYTALEGSPAPVDCLDTHDCTRKNRCAARSVWRELQEARERILGGTTLAELVEREKKLDTPGRGAGLLSPSTDPVRHTRAGG